MSEGDKEEMQLKKVTKYGYGAGHIINDMANSLWFSLLLLFYVDVIKLGGIYAVLNLFIHRLPFVIQTRLYFLKMNFYMAQTLTLVMRS